MIEMRRKRGVGPPSFRRRHHSLFSIFFKFNGDDDFVVVGQANKFVSTTSLERKMSVSIAFLLHFLDKKSSFARQLFADLGI